MIDKVEATRATVNSDSGSHLVLKPQKMVVNFHECINGEVIGSLQETDSGQLTFEGDVEDSAKVFFDSVCVFNNSEVLKMKQENAELREILKKLIGNGIDLLNVDDVEYEEDAASIHAKFNDVVNSAGALLAKHKA